MALSDFTPLPEEDKETTKYFVFEATSNIKYA
jgi:hypothetical protein